jgi:UDPglucose 6-dehydrogenase
MKIAIVGTGYVGLVSGTCFAEMGTEVFCVDINKEKIEKLKNGIIPIYEPGLEELVHKNYANSRLHFTSDITEPLNEIDLLFIAVGTPPDEDGSADLRYVLEVARTVGKYMSKYLLIVTKSTVPVGTAQKVRQVIQYEQDKRNVNIEFDIASNPEFLKEGAAVKDFMNPDRVVVGVESERAKQLMSKLYRPFLLNNFPVIFMDVASAEMTKYAANAMLATRISFMNEIANLCERVGADVSKVRQGIGSDSRIGRSFLYPGCGYGGSCFPKDVKALVRTGTDNNYNMKILNAVEAVNDEQKHILFNKLIDFYSGSLNGIKVAIWGLSFKPETDDMREAPSLILIKDLLQAGSTISVYDPVALSEAKRQLGDLVYYASDIYDAINDADALLLVTEWKEFRLPSWTIIKERMNNPLIIDGRNIYDPIELQNYGFVYKCIGRK